MRTKGGGNPIDILVGSRIRMFRKGRSMSQAQLGEKLGVTFQQVQKYENGKNRVGASRLQMISTALEVPVGQFFTDNAETIDSAKPLAFDPQALRFAEAFIRLNEVRCATRFLIWLRPWREKRLVSDIARLADFTVWPRKSFCLTATIKRPVLEKIVGGQFRGQVPVGAHLRNFAALAQTAAPGRLIAASPNASSPLQRGFISISARRAREE